MLFAGSHLLTVDDKGRLAIPARFRQALADQCESQLVITMGYEACLEIYPAREFARIAQAIEAMDNREHAELLKRAFVGRAVETEIDKQGRVALPPIQRSPPPVVMAVGVPALPAFSHTPPAVLVPVLASVLDQRMTLAPFVVMLLDPPSVIWSAALKVTAPAVPEAVVSMLPLRAMLPPVSDTAPMWVMVLPAADVTLPVPAFTVRLEVPAVW